MSNLRIFALAETAEAEAKLAGLAKTAEETQGRIGSSAKTAASDMENAFNSGTSRVGGLLRNLGNSASNFGIPMAGSLNNIADHFEKANSAGQKFAGVMSEMGKLSLGAGAVGFGAMAYEGVKSFMNLQQQMEMIHTQAGASQTEVNNMTKAVENMAGSVATGPQALAQSLYHVESVGLRGAKALQVLRIAAEGAKIGNANLVDVQNALDSAVVSGIQGAQNYTQAMGQLNATVGAGDMTMQDMADAMSTALLGTAKTYGMSLSQVGAALAVFGDNNLRGSAAATRLRQAMVMMAAPSKAATQALNVIGLSATSLAGAMRSGGLIPALQLLQEHIKQTGLNSTQAGLVLARAFGGGRTSSGILLLLNELQRLQTKQADIQRGGQNFGKDWIATTHTLKYALDTVVASVQALVTKFGGALIPKLKEGAHVLMAVANWFQKNKAAAEALAIVIATVLGAAIAGFVGGKIAAMVGGIQKIITWTKTWATTTETDSAKVVAANEEVELSVAGMPAVAESAGAGVAAAEQGMVASSEEAAVGIDGALLSTGIGAILVLLGVAADELYHHWRGVWTGIQEVTYTIANAIINVINGIIQGIDDLSLGLVHISELSHVTIGHGPAGPVGPATMHDIRHNWDKRSTKSGGWHLSQVHLGAGNPNAISNLTSPTAKSASSLQSEGQSLMSTIQGAVAAGSITGLRRVTTPAEHERVNTLVTQLVATHQSALIALADQLDATWRSATTALNEELAIQQKTAEADRTQMFATEMNDMTTLMSDISSSVVAGIQAASTAAADRSNAAMQVLSDHAQIVADRLGERGKFGLQLAAQEMKVGRDEITAKWDPVIAKAQAILDKINEHGNKAIEQSQKRLDEVTKAQDARIQAAQTRVDLAALGTQMQQQQAAANLKRVEADAAKAEAEAKRQLQNTKDSVAQAAAAAQANLTTAQQNAKYAEAKQQELITIEEAKAGAQFAGSGMTINVYANAGGSAAAAVAEEVAWTARTKIPVH